MYNRYIRNDAGQYERVPVQEPPGPETAPPGEGPGGYPPPFPGGDPPSPPQSAPPPPLQQPQQPTPPKPRGGGQGGIISGILEKLNLKDVDTGDLLLLLLIFLLFREGEDEELLIALGLLLVL